MAEQLSNSLATTTLAEPLAIDGLALTLASDAEFPSGPTFRIALFNNRYNPTAVEIVTVTAGGSGVAFPWTIERAQEGTSAAAWESGDYAACVLTADGLNDWTGEQIAAAVAAITPESIGAAADDHDHTGAYDPAGTGAAAVAAHVLEADPHGQYVTDAEHALIDHTGITGVPSTAGLLDETAHDALDHTGLTGVPSTAGLLDETAHALIDHTGLPGVGTGGVTDHGELDGLADDDHSQYHTDARHALIDHTGIPGVPSTAGLLDETAHDALDHTGLTGIPSVAGLLDETAHDALDHSGLTGIPSIAGLLDETAHDALDHTGLTGVLSSIPTHSHAGLQLGDGGLIQASVLKSGTEGSYATDGHVLTADGAGGVAWEAPPAGGTVDAADVTYTPAVLADWDGDADPGDLDDALDQLAARVKGVEGGAGAGTFLGLSDTPAAYTGHGGKFVAVKADGSGLEFVAAPEGSGPFDGSLATGFAEYTATLADSGIAVE